MNNSDLLGSKLFPWHEALWSAVARQYVQRERLPHGVIIEGDSSLAPELLAWQLVNLLFCAKPSEELLPCGECLDCRLLKGGNHPDFLPLEQDDPAVALKLEHILQIGEFFACGANQEGWRVVLAHRANGLTLAASNALLKILEEPPDHSIIILVVNASAFLPQTIRSRCQKIILPLPPRAAVQRWLEGELPGSDVSLLAALADGRPLYAKHLGQSDSLQQRGKLLTAMFDLKRGAGSTEVAIKAAMELDFEELLDILWNLVGDLLRCLVLSPHGESALVNLDFRNQINQLIAARGVSQEQLWQYQGHISLLKKGVKQGIAINRQLVIEGLLGLWVDHSMSMAI